MESYNSLSIIRNSFEQWYNQHLTSKDRMSMVTNYSDEQTLSIKAYHKVTVSIQAVGIKNGLSYIVPILTISGHYNHGVTTEEEAQTEILQKFLLELFNYCRSKGNSN